MPETGTAADAQPDAGTTPPDTGTATQPDTDWKAEADKWKSLARKHEEQAKANVAAAQRLAQIEDEQKTEAQKLTERASIAEQEAQAARLELARYRVAATKGLPADLAEHLVGATEEELSASADRLLAAAAKLSGSQAPPDLKQGAGRGAVPSSQGDWFRSKFAR